jgi:hypothetical protein
MKRGSHQVIRISLKIGKNQELNKRSSIKLQKFYCCELGHQDFRALGALRRENAVSDMTIEHISGLDC